MTAAGPDRRRSARRFAVIGALAAVPRFVLACLVLPSAYDLVLLLSTFAAVAGALLLAIGYVRWCGTVTPRAWLPAATGLAAVLVAGAVVVAFPPTAAPVAYAGGLLVPPAAIAYQWGYLLLGVLSQCGVFTVVGAIGAAIRRRQARRTA